MNSNKDGKLTTVIGQPSWGVASSSVEAYITRCGGHMAPVVFDLGGGHTASPYAVAPWAEDAMAEDESESTHALRGDFFCMPFGNNARPFQGEEHPSYHGETVNGVWSFEGSHSEDGRHALHLSMTPQVRPGRVDKYLSLRDGHAAIYSQHVISGMAGPMNLGHHATLKFPDEEGSGVVSTSAFVHGMVVPRPADAAATFTMKPGASFESLACVPGADGGTIDLTRYPARRGFDDNALIVSDTDVPFAWSAATFAKEGFVWFALKDPNVLRHTMFWLSNGGQKAKPWNGRNFSVMGIEEITSYFDKGLAGSAEPNALSELGYPTHVNLSASTPLVVNYIMAVAAIPEGFDEVAEIIAVNGDEAVILQSKSGKRVRAAVDVGFLRGGG